MFKFNHCTQKGEVHIFQEKQSAVHKSLECVSEIICNHLKFNDDKETTQCKHVLFIWHGEHVLTTF